MLFSCSFLVPVILSSLFLTEDKIHFMFSQPCRLFVGNPVFFFFFPIKMKNSQDFFKCMNVKESLMAFLLGQL